MKKVLISCAIAACIIFGISYANATTVELDEKLPNDGVLTVTAGDLGVYKIDTRFDLCFLVPRVAVNTTHGYGHMKGPVVQIPCKPFDNLHGNQ